MLVGDRVVVTATGVRTFGGPVEESWTSAGPGPGVAEPRPRARRLRPPPADPGRPTGPSPARCSPPGSTATRSGWSRPRHLPCDFVYPAEGTDRTRALAQEPGTGEGEHPRRLAAPRLATAPRARRLSLRSRSTPRAGSRRAARSRSPAFDVDTPDERSSVAVDRRGDTVYSSTERLYSRDPPSTHDLSPQPAWLPSAGLCAAQPLRHRRPRVRPARSAASYTASGSVRGVLKDRWSLDEHDGHLRLAIETGSPFATDDGAATAAAPTRSSR